MKRDQNLDEYLGSRHSALGFLLFAFGVAALLAFAIIAVQLGVTDEPNDLGHIVWLIPLWSAVAIPLGFSMRRKEPSIPALVLGCALLAIPAGLALVSRF